MALKIYPFLALTGGTEGCLDKIDGGALQEGDMAFGRDSTYGFCLFFLDADSGASESVPDVVAPDTNAGNKRWIRQNLYHDEYRVMWVPASAFVSKATAGAGFGTKEYATNDVNRDYYAFDKSTQEYVDIPVTFPDGWDMGTIKAKFVWSADSESGGVRWGLKGAAKRDDDAIDASYGTAQEVSDTLIATGDNHITSATPAITIGGTKAAGCTVDLCVYRYPAHADDTLNADALLFGVLIQYRIAGVQATSW